MVCTPFWTNTVAVPAARLLPNSNPPGKVVTAARTVPDSKVSVMVTGPADCTKAALQDPPGGGPAGTVTGIPPTRNTKFVPVTMPAPATLQICRNPVGDTGILAFWKVTIVHPPALIVTVAWPAARSLLTSNPLGVVPTAVN